jgi:hypothetical protein
MAAQEKLPQEVWEVVIAMARAVKRKASAEELVNLSAALRLAKRRHRLTNDDIAAMLMG